MDCTGRISPLQNRVTPFGDIVALPGRGDMLGNRGILHDDHRKIVRPWQVRRWISCRLHWRNVRRTLMTPHRWTELFFLDEAAAFAAGHRPCAFCRNADYKRFRALWERCFGSPAKADDIDNVLHAERLNRREKRTWIACVDDLPDGTFVTIDGVASLVWRSELVAWSDAGYTSRRMRPRLIDVEVLTPASVVEVFRSGYEPSVHASVKEAALRS